MATKKLVVQLVAVVILKLNAFGVKTFRWRICISRVASLYVNVVLNLRR